MITPLELKSLLDNNTDLLLLDIREPDEFAYTHIPSSTNTPLSTIETFAFIQLTNKTTIIISQHEGRALAAKEFIKTKGNFNLKILKGGIESYSNQVSRKIFKY